MPNTYTMFRDHKETTLIDTILLKQLAQPGAFCFDCLIVQPEVDYPAMGNPPPEDQLPKVTIVCDQYAVFIAC